MDIETRSNGFSRTIFQGSLPGTEEKTAERDGPMTFMSGLEGALTR